MLSDFIEPVHLFINCRGRREMILYIVVYLLAVSFLNFMCKFFLLCVFSIFVFSSSCRVVRLFLCSPMLLLIHHGACLFVCLVVCLFVCLVGWLVGWLFVCLFGLVWLVQSGFALFGFVWFVCLVSSRCIALPGCGGNWKPCRHTPAGGRSSVGSAQWTVQGATAGGRNQTG